MSRVKLLPRDNASPEVKRIYDKVEKRGAMVFNLYKVLAHSPSILNNLLKLGNILITETELSPKLREMTILRIARLSDSEYEWAQHYNMALEAGVSREQAEAIANWKESERFSKEERAVLQYVDEVAKDVTADDETFETLRKYLSERSIVELTVSIGYWCMIARLLVPLQVDMDTQFIGSAKDLAGHSR